MFKHTLNNLRNSIKEFQEYGQKTIEAELSKTFYNEVVFRSYIGLYAQIYADKHPENLLSLFLCWAGSGTGTEWKQIEKEVMQLNKSKCTSIQWMTMGINNVFGILGSNNAYKRLFKQVMKNYNEDFVNTDALEIDFGNFKSTPINKTRPEILKYPILPKQEDPKYRITLIYGD